MNVFEMKLLFCIIITVHQFVNHIAFFASPL